MEFGAALLPEHEEGRAVLETAGASGGESVESAKLPAGSGPGTAAVAVDFGERGVQLTDGDVSIGIGMPARRHSSQGGQVLYGHGEYSVCVRSLETGVAASIQIAAPSAPHRYEFDFDLPPGWYLESTQLNAEAVTIFDEQNRPRGSIAPPWAVDADGNQVPTSLAVVGPSTLVQTVVFDDTTSFPVVADPYVTLGTHIYFWVRGYEIYWYGAVSTYVLATYICAQSDGYLCPIAYSTAQAVQLALSLVWYTNDCQYVLAFRRWLALDYVERINAYGCTYQKYELPF